MDTQTTTHPSLMLSCFVMLAVSLTKKVEEIILAATPITKKVMVPITRPWAKKPWESPMAGAHTPETFLGLEPDTLPTGWPVQPGAEKRRYCWLLIDLQNIGHLCIFMSFYVILKISTINILGCQWFRPKPTASQRSSNAWSSVPTWVGFQWKEQQKFRTVPWWLEIKMCTADGIKHASYPLNVCNLTYIVWCNEIQET